MKLQKENRFKKAIGSFLVMCAIGAVVTGIPQDIMKMVDEWQTSREQTEIVTEAINPEYETIQAEEVQEEPTDDYVSKYDFDKLRETNPNIIGVIEGDMFEGGYYPVVSTENFDEENYYLNHSVDGSENSLGTIFADYTNDNSMQGNVTRIWGHHFAGFENVGKMFSSLVNYDTQEYYESHRTLRYYTDNGEYDLEVFACTKDNPLNQQIGTFASGDEYYNNINDVESRSMIQSDVEVTNEDRIMILTTCTRAGSANEPDQRISVYTKVNPVYERIMQNSKTK